MIGGVLLFSLFACAFFSDIVNFALIELPGENEGLMGPKRGGRKGVSTFVFHTLSDMENMKSVLV